MKIKLFFLYIFAINTMAGPCEKCGARCEGLICNNCRIADLTFECNGCCAGSCRKCGTKRLPSVEDTATFAMFSFSEVLLPEVNYPPRASSGKRRKGLKSQVEGSGFIVNRNSQVRTALTDDEHYAVKSFYEIDGNDREKKYITELSNRDNLTLYLVKEKSTETFIVIEFSTENPAAHVIQPGQPNFYVEFNVREEGEKYLCANNIIEQLSVLLEIIKNFFTSLDETYNWLVEVDEGVFELENCPYSDSSDSDDDISKG